MEACIAPSLFLFASLIPLFHLRDHRSDFDISSCAWCPEDLSAREKQPQNPARQAVPPNFQRPDIIEPHVFLRCWPPTAVSGPATVKKRLKTKNRSQGNSRKFRGPGTRKCGRRKSGPSGDLSSRAGPLWQPRAVQRRSHTSLLAPHSSLGKTLHWLFYCLSPPSVSKPLRFLGRSAAHCPPPPARAISC